MLQTSTKPNAAIRRVATDSRATLRSAVNLKSVALLLAACAYIGLGYATFQVACAITGDNDSANWIVACLSIPLAAPLVYAIGWIEKHF